MASEIRVNTINSRTGLGTITVSETGQDLAGITTIATLHAGDSINNVGINETSPQTALHVGAGGVVRFERGDGARYGELWNDNSFVELKASTDPIRINPQSYLRFDIGGNEKIRIDSSGRLLVGATAKRNVLNQNGNSAGAVSYTHLKLPTILLV